MPTQRARERGEQGPARTWPGGRHQPLGHRFCHRGFPCAPFEAAPCLEYVTQVHVRRQLDIGRAKRQSRMLDRIDPDHSYAVVPRRTTVEQGKQRPVTRSKAAARALVVRSRHDAAAHARTDPAHGIRVLQWWSSSGPPCFLAHGDERAVLAARRADTSSSVPTPPRRYKTLTAPRGCYTARLRATDARLLYDPLRLGGSHSVWLCPRSPLTPDCSRLLKLLPDRDGGRTPPPPPGDRRRGEGAILRTMLLTA